MENIYPLKIDIDKYHSHRRNTGKKKRVDKVNSKYSLYHYPYFLQIILNYQFFYIFFFYSFAIVARSDAYHIAIIFIEASPIPKTAFLALLPPIHPLHSLSTSCPLQIYRDRKLIIAISYKWTGHLIRLYIKSYS